MKISEFLSENFQFLFFKFSIHLNRRVFVVTRNVSKGYECSRMKSKRKIANTRRGRGRADRGNTVCPSLRMAGA